MYMKNNFEIYQINNDDLLKSLLSMLNVNVVVSIRESMGLKCLILIWD